MIIPLFFTLSLFLPGPIAAVWGFRVLMYRETSLTRRRVIRGGSADAVGRFAIVMGVAYVPFLLHLFAKYETKGW